MVLAKVSLLASLVLLPFSQFMRDLTLCAHPSHWQKFIARRLSAGFSAIAEKIFKRDRYTCQYCEFQAKDHLDIVNHDQDYTNNKASNLVTACPFCSQCFFLESIGLDDRSGGQLVHMPEVSQSELNAFCHALFRAMAGTSYQDDAQIVYRNLKHRTQAVEKALGEGASDPRRMGAMLIEYQTMKEGDISATVLKELRLLPIQSKFTVQLSAWNKTAMKGL